MWRDAIKTAVLREIVRCDSEADLLLTELPSSRHVHETAFERRPLKSTSTNERLIVRSWELRSIWILRKTYILTHTHYPRGSTGETYGRCTIVRTAQTSAKTLISALSA